MRKIFLFISVLSLCSVCPAAIITVDDNAPADYSNIQAAINAANNGDTIIVQPGTYTGPGNRDIDFLGKAITVRSTEPNDPWIVANTVVDCGGTNHRGFKFVSGEGRASILDGLTITNAYIEVMCEGGAGIYIVVSSPTISRCVITDNHAELMSGSLCFCFGGGIYISGLYEAKSSPLITNCTISGNSVGDWGWGGGIYCEGLSDTTIHNCLVSNNYALGYAGEGGGICHGSSGNSTITNCTIVDNSAADNGGGIWFGGNGYMTITNSIVWDNAPDQIYPMSGTTISVAYSDVEGGYAGIGNIDTNPLFADPNNGNYHLKSQAGRWNPSTQSWVKDDVTSLCIDAGDPNSDWRRELWPNGRRINMGAYGGTPQASMSLSTLCSIADLDNDCDVDFNDLKLFTQKWLSQGVLLAADLDRNGDVNFMDFAIFGSEYYKENPAPGITYHVGGCGEGLLLMREADATRFTVTVNGHNIHFGDKVTANCCLTGFEVTMGVYGNQIILYEREYLDGMPCTCECDYPVTADLGPFTSGTYTLIVLEVYNGHYNEVGTTTVNIE